MSLRAPFLGTSDFAAEVLEELVRDGVEVPLVVTQPDRPAGRKRRPTPPPVAVAATRLGLPCLQPERVADVVPDLEALNPVVGVVCAYGQILPPSVLGICPWLNLHPSLLPRWRGAAPIERAILAGDDRTGVAVMQTVAALDAGPVVDQVAFPIAPDADAQDVARAALDAGVPLLLSALAAAAAAGTLQAVEQSEEGASYAEKLTRADRLLDPMSSTAQGAHDQVRALRPHIGALIDLEGQTVTIWRTTPSTVEVPAGAVEVDGDHLRIGFTDGALDVLEVQIPGRRALPAAEWLRGARAVPTRARRPT